jgi:hypothetical protein
LKISRHHTRRKNFRQVQQFYGSSRYELGESRFKTKLTAKHANDTKNRFVLASFRLFSSGFCRRQSDNANSK